VGVNAKVDRKHVSGEVRGAPPIPECDEIVWQSNPKSGYSLETRRTPAMEEINDSAKRRTTSFDSLNIASGRDPKATSYLSGSPRMTSAPGDNLHHPI